MFKSRRENGEGTITVEGYKVVQGVDHPNARGRRRRIPEHVMIMSDALGRPLCEGEIVHHKNGVRSDNRLENLELCTTYTHHKGQSIKDIVEHYLPDYITLYGADRLQAFIGRRIRDTEPLEKAERLQTDQPGEAESDTRESGS